MTSYLKYKRDVAAVLDADDTDIESWITVRGNHIPIKKGQSKEEAVKSFIESKGGEYKKESYGKHYVKYGEGENKRYASPRNDLIYSEKSRAGFFGSEKEAKEYAEKLNHKDPYAGTEFAMKNYKRTVLPYEVESEPEQNTSSEQKSKTTDPKIEFQEAFKGSKWNSGNGFATYEDGDYRFEIYREGNMYVSTVSPSDDYDGSEVEEEEMFSSLESARKQAEEWIEEYGEPDDDAKSAKVDVVKKIANGSVQYEKVGKVFRLTGYYTGESVDLDFEKLTGHSSESSVRYEMHGGKLLIQEYNGRWEKEIDFNDLGDEEIADLIRR